MKYFHNVFAYYDKSKPKEIKCHRNYTFISYDMMLKYICAKNLICHNLLKLQIYLRNGCKYLNEICNIY